MAATQKKRIKDKMEDKLHPAETEAERHDARALATLAALLDSTDEHVRLEAAKAILTRPRPAPAPSKMASVMKGVSKVV